MRKIAHFAALLPLLLCLSHPARAADDLMASQMADEARTWQQKDRDDLAAELWRKLLRAAPAHPEALVKLGLIEARAGNLAQAGALLARARKLPRPPAGLDQLARAVQGLEAAAAPARPAAPATLVAKSAPAAKPAATTPTPKPVMPAGTARVAAVPSAVPSALPSAKVRTRAAAAALAPFQSAAAREQDWAASRAGLEQLAQANPNDPVYLLALARHLGWNVASRREALRQLAALATGRKRPAGAVAAWRDTLLQLEPRAGDEPLYAQYTARFPRDKEVAARAAQLRAGGGVATMSGAVEPFVLAASAAPDRAAPLLGQALADERAGDHGAAAAKLEQAMLLAPANGAVRIALARQYQALDRSAEAENLLDALLEAQPDLPAALLARARLFGLQQRWTEGLDLLERIAPAQRDGLAVAQQRSLWIGAQLERARQLASDGAAPEALAIVTAAQQAALADPSQLVPVALAWNDIGQPAQGLRLLRERLGLAGGDLTGMRLAYARLLLDSFEDAELGAVLRDLGAQGRLNPGQQTALDRIAVVHALRQAEQLREAGRHADAAARLAPWLARGPEPRVLMGMARIRRAAGDAAGALQLAEQAVSLEGSALDQRLLACELALALDNPDRAGVHADAALTLAPRHPRALAAAGRVARARGKLPEAQAYFQRAGDAERDPAAFAGVAGSHALRLLEDPAP